MLRKAIRIMILIPMLTLLWGYANALGVTQAVNEATPLHLPTAFKIPYIDQKWAVGQKAIPHPQIVALATIREAGRQGLAQKALTGTIENAKNAGLTAKQIKAEYDKGLAESEAKYPQTPATAAPQKMAAPVAKTTTTRSKALSLAAYKRAKVLPVKGRAPKTGYSRDQFGVAWTDSMDIAYGHNGCDTRNDILGRDLVKKTYKAGTQNCKVLTGTLPYEPYLGLRNYKFSTAGGFDMSLDVEHLVALGDAWQKGAQQLTKTKRTELANDPINLMMTDPGQNRSKGDADAATWLPKNKAYRCTYIVKQVNVKTKYHLFVTKAEQDAMLRVLKTCV